MAELFRHIHARFVPTPLPSKGAFAGQTVLVTGGTTGLGLAAAVHFLNLGAAEVIITARKAASARAEDARQEILSQKDEDAEGMVTVMELDMNSYRSCVALVDGLKKRFDGGKGGDLGAAVLNAGVMNGRYIRSPTGIEETIQVDALSTTCLALLLLRWMKEKRSSAPSGPPPRIVLVGSSGHYRVGIEQWPSWVEEDGSLLAHCSQEENWPGVESAMQIMYGYAKLMLEYAKQELCKMASDAKGKPAVVITSVCPGPVMTDIGRTTEHGIVMRFLRSCGYRGLGKSPDYGSRVYIRAALAEAEDHGKFLTDFISEVEYKAKTAPLIKSKEAQEMQRQVWKEISETLRTEVPAAQEAFKQLAVS